MIAPIGDHLYEFSIVAVAIIDRHGCRGNRDDLDTMENPMTKQNIAWDIATAIGAIIWTAICGWMIFTA
jgi:hypothetical protein